MYVCVCVCVGGGGGGGVDLKYHKQRAGVDLMCIVTHSRGLEKVTKSIYFKYTTAFICRE